ncbi:type III-A CRISPR-associated protein Csm2 [Spirulina sp. 06S082]|uniref:type III-A CRISPR-associated protein Csm2 n=1 Tax=Spirulina sp. 06S082 TaxID=3110248 RepID=UPI002B1FD9FA|nr:type III-A CRISPR-associated protein Csm2 [Spirulina sp. 06S082]MEA5471209.1 type III-A CRISPR-associated protein Csm2 [Spirulina sp. 06S082]
MPQLNQPQPRNRDQNRQSQPRNQQNRQDNQSTTVQTIITQINKLSEGLKGYPIRELVNHAETFGPELKRQKLETNQIRKFLDAINQIKSKFTQAYEDINTEDKKQNEIQQLVFKKLEPDIVLLKPKLAYAAARQKAVEPLSRVMAIAIDKVRDRTDFERLVQLIESIIAYHKAEGGK